MNPKSLAVSALGRLYFGPPSVEAHYGRPVAWAEDGSRVVARTLAAGSPCMIARFGSAELACAIYYLRWRRRRIKLRYPESLRRLLHVNAGFFPADDRSLDALARLYLDSVQQVDVFAVWFNRGEERIVRQYCLGADLVELGALLSMLYETPWSAELAGKRVLAVHPFADTIRSQYEDNRALLFADSHVLPEFELTTLKPPQSIAGSDCGFDTWFDAFEDTRDRIGRESYDIALIGAGAYGLPLAAFVKSQGRQAVHMGGATQLLFGIKGRRWEVESPDDIVPLFNEHWVRPSADETPEGSSLVEGGCYW